MKDDLKKLLKPSSILLYVLSSTVLLMMGMAYAGITGAADGQGLAGGAIILVYGIIFSIAGLISSVLTAYYFSNAVVVRLNWIAAFLLFLFITILFTLKPGHRSQIRLMPALF
ncbi:hypothetical protein ACH3O9_12380 [Leeuwenhoekiella sp. A16]|uniref:hypothetical protein n=1 Tax=unclassified Leeuwenhoekiella TaxID=2615029 RepID=UPI003A80650C|tara:strand:+ start:712 stop:1050 length:339 start_codon:yes stop_codon:yes gene_type:complete